MLHEVGNLKHQVHSSLLTENKTRYHRVLLLLLLLRCTLQWA